MTPVAVVYDLCDGASLVEFDGASDAEANLAAVALAGALLSPRVDGLLDAIPGARTLFLVFDPIRLGHEALRREALSRASQPAPAASARTLSIGVLYGGEMGPDLAELASRAHRTPEELARLHAAGDYVVAFLGFAPGFAYLAGLDPSLHAARLATPRPRVPAGSVAIGGPYTGVYPGPTPGGWRLLGRSAVRLFDEESDPPVLLSPGDRVRFEALTPARFALLQQELETASSRSPTSPGGRPVLRVVRPGVFTSVQGAPRFGAGASGLPPGGAVDEGALARGNARLGNPGSAGALEMTLLGPELEAMAEFGLCLSGGATPLERNGVVVAARLPVRVETGDRLRLGPVRQGARSYLCVEGGLQAPGRLGLTRRLEAGQILMAESRKGSASEPQAGERPEGVEEGDRLQPDILLRIVLDPRGDRFFPPSAVAEFLSSAFRVSSTSDRRGIRLEGRAVGAAGSSEVPPEGTALGTVQVPPDGQPILLGPDRPITGGYARIGTVIATDWPRIAQAPPGRTVRFSTVTLAEALAARSGRARGEE